MNRMTMIAITGSKDECKAVMEKIKEHIPGAGPAFFMPDGKRLCCEVDCIPENGYNVPKINRPGAEEIVAFCDDWKSKWDVSKTLNADYRTVGIVMDSLANDGHLVRILELPPDQKKRVGRYLYMDAEKCKLCQDCQGARISPSGIIICWPNDDYPPKKPHCDSCGCYTPPGAEIPKDWRWWEQ